MLNSEKVRPLVLVIAGVDSGGGAGISADCITIHDNGAFALPCVSALTSQSLSRVSKVVSTDIALFKDTLNLAAKDWPCGISAIKIGLITSKAILDCVIESLGTTFKGVPVVWDPVLTATAGRLDSADLKANLDKICKVTTLFTPNLIEALELASWTKDDLNKKGIEALADVFLKKGLKTIIIKGGHVDNASEAKDFFASENLKFFMSYERKEGDGAHGGGCALSSALAAYMAQKYASYDAAIMAKAYVTQGICETEIHVGNVRPPIAHHGMPNDVKYLPKVSTVDFPVSALPFAPCPDYLGLYPIVDSVHWVELLLAIGVRTIQLRIDNEDKDALFDDIKRAVFLGRSYNARVFIAKHYELAIKAGAYGVHLNLEDVKKADVNKIRDAGLRLGISTYGFYEMCMAITLMPSYIALGHVFETKSHDVSRPQGLDRIALQASMLQGIVPTVAVGGVTVDNLDEVMQTKVGSVAMISSILKADDPLLATQELLYKLPSC